MGELFLGVDGGNTKTIAVLAGRDGAVAGAGYGGCTDIHNAAPGDAVAEAARAVHAALEAAAAGPDDVDRAILSLAGADWPEDFAYLHAGITQRTGLSPSRTTVVNDAIGAIRSGTSDGVGIAVVCGTGGAVGARNANGDVFHYGFWPDGTGGAALAEQALAAVWRADLGVGPATSLTTRALERWGASDPLDLLHRFTRLDPPPISQVEKALFSRELLDEAATGDPVAVEIVTLAGKRLGGYARVSAARVGLLEGGFPLVLCGGVLRHPSPLMRDAIMAQLPEGQPVAAAAEPVVGAVLLAADAAGVSLGPAGGETALRSWAPE